MTSAEFSSANALRESDMNCFNAVESLVLWGYTGQSNDSFKQRIAANKIDMLKSFSTQQQHNQYNEQNIADAVITFKPI